MRAMIFLLLMAGSQWLAAEEGMWIPVLLERLNISQMQDLGLKLSAEDIYSVNHSSLKDAIVQFGGGCTAGIISASGLILTNHHCGYGAIQRQSSLEHDYLTNGFWARSLEEELPIPGLTVTLLVHMEEVTGKVLAGVDDGMNQLNRNRLIKRNIEAIEKEATAGTHYEAKVRSFFYGNQYYLFINEVFRDIRLAGAPPSCIGNFGGDTDNWMWPRHTGDFSLFRIYASKENRPNEYSKENVPYKPKSFIPVSLRGYQKGDFTFIFGYPGTTREYIPSFGVELTAFRENPLRTRLREKRLDIIHSAMEGNRLIRIQYAAKAAGIANGWKKMIGETKGIQRMEVVEKKQKYERSFQEWVDSVSIRKVRLGGLLKEFEQAYGEYDPIDLSLLYLTEAGMSIEVVRFADQFRKLITLARDRKTTSESLQKMTGDLRKATRDFFKNYQPAVDHQLMVSMLEAIGKEMAQQYRPEIFSFIQKRYRDNYTSYADMIFRNSLLVDSTRIISFLNRFRPSMVKKLADDPAYRLSQSIYTRHEQDLLPRSVRLISRLDSLQRIYMAAQMEMQKERRFYPDANSTLRIAYGKVNDLSPSDALNYAYFTTLTGVMQKEDSTIYDYVVDPRLKSLYRNRDYGRYADKDGTMHVAFTATNHTSGGNSGSPVLNAEGQLIGINFDRNWEGTLSDLMYDPSQCRNITLDIRYCLFIIDRLAGAKRLTDEMTIVE